MKRWSAGLLRYGFPGFERARSLIDRRIEEMHPEGVQF
jgi:NADPH-dependent glutamate synthase beta subunit-like oxidoreductase